MRLGAGWPSTSRRCRRFSRAQRFTALRHRCGISESTLIRARTSSLRLVSCVVVQISDRGHCGLPREILAMELLERRGAAGGIAAHLVQRRQGKVAVEGRVLDPLGHHGAGHLLEAADEQLPLAAAGLVQVGRAFQQQHVADEVEHGGVGGRVAAFRLRRRAADDLPVALRNVTLANVRAIDGKAGQDFAQRDPQRVEREIPRAPVPLGNAIEPVGEQLQIARHGRAEDQQLRLVGHLAEIEPLVDEAAVDLGQLGQPGRIDEQPAHGVQKIVARGAGQQPLFGQGLLGAEDLFHHHVERKRCAVGAGHCGHLRQERRLDVAPRRRGSPARWRRATAAAERPRVARWYRALPRASR